MPRWTWRTVWAVLVVTALGVFGTGALLACFDRPILDEIYQDIEARRDVDSMRVLLEAHRLLAWPLTALLVGLVVATSVAALRHRRSRQIWIAAAVALTALLAGIGSWNSGRQLHDFRNSDELKNWQATAAQTTPFLGQDRAVAPFAERLNGMYLSHCIAWPFIAALCAIVAAVFIRPSRLQKSPASSVQTRT